MRKKVLFTAHPSTDRKKKNLLFLNLIRTRKSTSRTEISKLTNTNVVTVSNYINSYLKKGLALETGYEVSSGGRRPELVELNKKWGYTIGIDMAPGCVNAVLADPYMEKLASESMDHDKKEPKNSIMKVVEKLLEGGKADRSLVKKIGITAYPDDTLEGAQKLGGEIEAELGIPVLSASAGLSAAFAEKNLNPEAIEASKVLFIYTSLGEGIFIAGDEFYEGKNGEKECAYLAPWGRKLDIAEKAREVVAGGVGTKIVDMAGGDVEKISAEMIVNAARERDEIAADILRTAATNLSVRAAYLINLLEPEVAIIGGGAEKAEDLFFKPLAANAKKLSSHGAPSKAKVIPAVLSKDARASGAAFLAIREAFIET